MFRIILIFVFWTRCASAQYSLDLKVDSSNFLDHFLFFTRKDPVGGVVEYVDVATAKSNDMFSIDSSTNSWKMAAESEKIVADGSGRQSIRAESLGRWNDGLFLFDFSHMPFGCGTWPALWSISRFGGEIDMLEGVNVAKASSPNIHAMSMGCFSVPYSERNQTGTPRLNTCSPVNDPSGLKGCSTLVDDPKSIGEGFNSVGGGVYAMELQPNEIKIWLLDRDNLPSDIQSGTPIPENWPIPLVHFPLDCCAWTDFVQQKIVISLTFCGRWGSLDYENDRTQGCPAGSCEDFVRNNPSAFEEAFWRFNDIKIYRKPSLEGNIFEMSFNTEPKIPRDTCPAGTNNIPNLENKSSAATIFDFNLFSIIFLSILVF